METRERTYIGRGIIGYTETESKHIYKQHTAHTLALARCTCTCTWHMHMHMAHTAGGEDKNTTASRDNERGYVEH